MTHSPPSPLQLGEVQAAQAHLLQVQREVSKSFIGDTQPINMMLVALLGQGHVLLEGVPGVAKTTLVRAFSQSLGCDMRRIQFTPDLLPQDITGTYILNPKQGTFELRRGPIFSQVVLADEINRAPARTQSALLEAMQEAQVTIEGERFQLERPFLVLATQNPLDQEGTFPLPEAQIDRFLVQIELGYPSRKDEVAMLHAHGIAPPEVQPVLSAQSCIQLQEIASRVHVEVDMLQYATGLSRFTRQHPKVVLGCSPRATLSLIKAARGVAVLNGRPYVTPEDIRIAAPAVLAHRLVLQPELEGQLSQRRAVIEDALNQVDHQHPVMDR